MKKFCLLIVMLAVLWPSEASAQKKREISLSIGSTYEGFVVPNYYSQMEVWDLCSGYEGRYIKTETDPIIGLEYQYFVADRIKIGGILSWLRSCDKYYDPLQRRFTDSRDTHKAFLMAQAKYCYIRNEDWQLYSGLGLGGSLFMTFAEGDKFTPTPGFAYEAILLGVRQSLVVPVYAELVLGNAAFGIRCGIGLNF